MTRASLQELIRRGDPARQVSPAALRRIQLELSNRPRPRAPRMGGNRSVLALALVLGVPVAAAVLRGPLTQWLREAPTDQALVKPSPAPPPSEPLRAATQEAPVIATVVRSRIRSPATTSRAAVRPAAGGATPSALGVETRLLNAALHELRDQHDAQRALAALDDYRAQFPSGVLANEAALARIDALLALDRRSETLPLLAQLAGHADMPRASELRVLHGELLAEAGKCNTALAYFDDRGAPDLTPGLFERALYGRAVCRRLVGDLDGSREDFTSYLERFPQGRFASAVKRALGL